MSANAFHTETADETKFSIVNDGRELYSLTVINPNAYAVYLKLYDLALASVTVGSSEPKAVYPIPASGYLILTRESEALHGFFYAISAAITKLLADSDTTAITTDCTLDATYA